MKQKTLSLEEVYGLSLRTLQACGAEPRNAGPVAESIRDAEADGIRNVGLGYLAHYCEHLLHGQVDGTCDAKVTRATPSAMFIDALHGFAHSAFCSHLDDFVKLANQAGVAAMAIRHSHAAGVIGWYVEKLAMRGLVALGFANSPPAIAPWGGTTAFFGTNPLAFAVPRPSGPPLVIDQSSSATAKVNVMNAAQKGEPIPEGWALDKDGHPTTDAQAGLAGSMSPSGGYKGVSMAMIVDLMAGGLTGSNLSYEAPLFADKQRRSPNVGQFFIAFDPDQFDQGFCQHAESMFQAMLLQPGVRLPGDRRLAHRAEAQQSGVSVPQDLLDKLNGFCT